jgi:hypothetical protein
MGRSASRRAFPDVEVGAGAPTGAVVAGVVAVVVARVAAGVMTGAIATRAVAVFPVRAIRSAGGVGRRASERDPTDPTAAVMNASAARPPIASAPERRRVEREDWRMSTSVRKRRMTKLQWSWGRFRNGSPQAHATRDRLRINASPKAGLNQQ